MAETAVSLYLALGRRLRDPSNLAHPPVYVIPLLSYIQQIVNASTGAIKTSATVTFSSTIPHNFTDVTTALPTVARVERVLYQNQDLDRVPWPQYIHHDPYWARRAGSQPLQWDMVGRGLLTVWPSVLNTAESVTVIGTKVTTALTVGGSVTELPDQHMPAILSMAEQLLLLRQRLLASMKPAVEHFERALPTGIP